MDLLAGEDGDIVGTLDVVTAGGSREVSDFLGDLGVGDLGGAASGKNVPGGVEVNCSLGNLDSISSPADLLGCGGERGGG